MANPEKVTWSQAWKQTSFKIRCAFAVACVIFIGSVFPWFFDFIEGRSGPQLHDPVLDMLPAANVTWMVFGFLYGGMLLGFYSMSNSPQSFILCIHTYVLVTLMRMASLTLFPLNPPDGYIPLPDPIVQAFSNNGRIISRDLFFSGHVSTICSVLFAVSKPFHKRIILVCTIMVGFLVLVHRVHYTIDVLAAPVGTYLAYFLMKKVNR